VELQLAPEHVFVFCEQGDAKIAIEIGGDHQGADWRRYEISEELHRFCDFHFCVLGKDSADRGLDSGETVAKVRRDLSQRHPFRAPEAAEIGSK